MDNIKLLSLVQSMEVPSEDFMHWGRVANRFADDPNMWRLGLLHDIVEDNYVSMQELKEKCELSQEEVDVLTVLIRRSDETYMQYIARVGQNDKARLIKLADLYDNTMRCKKDLEKGATRERAKSLFERYRKAIRYLWRIEVTKG